MKWSLISHYDINSGRGGITTMARATGGRAARRVEDGHRVDDGVEIRDEDDGARRRFRSDDTATGSTTAWRSGARPRFRSDGTVAGLMTTRRQGVRMAEQGRGSVQMARPPG
ncbi:uncharacterized protein [Triticum aestivum]|uniref:uncharacterized protein n=1 Tax=Triticum aestivum TaxID=4565 RepID=UPI000E79D0F5|nr:uncharacterized protein LOC123149085 [Triticum aestivum]